MVFEPLLQIPAQPKMKQSDPAPAVPVSNKVLPLAYIDCKGFRIIIPSAEKYKTQDGPDVFIFQVESISLSPDPANPICRTPLRPDIYQQAARARVLNVPGLFRFPVYFVN